MSSEKFRNNRTLNNPSGLVPKFNTIQKRNVGTRWHFYIRTDETWMALKEAFLNAKKTIDIEQYILERDSTGQEFIEILIRKAKEGVKIRILCDMAGSYSFYASSLPESLRDVGIEVRFFNVIKPWRIHNFFSWFFRDHRKIITVDSMLGFVGGVGIRTDMKHWRDSHIKVWGKVVEEMQHAFEEMWHIAGEKKFLQKFKKAKHFVKGFQFVSNSPHIGKRFLYQEIVQAIRGAKKYIHLTTPYFVPDRRIRRILKLAAKRGVDVKILLPESSDVPLVDWASSSYYGKLLSAGVQIFHYQGELLHAKTAVIDGEWATIGSFNLDSLSFLYNYEANMVSTNKEFADELNYYFQNDLKSAKEITLYNWKNRPDNQKLLEIITLPIRRFL